MWIVYLREVKARVATKSFIVFTLLFPVIMGSFVAIPALVSGNTSQRTLVVVNEAPSSIADRFIDKLTRGGREDAAAPAPNTLRYKVERVDGSLAGRAEELNRRVLRKEIDGYVHLPADIVASSEIVYRARNISSMAVNQDLREAAKLAVQAERLSQAGIEPARLSAIVKDVSVNAGQVTKDSAEKGSARSSFFLAYIAAFLVYFTIITQGIGILRSVLEEKTNRISEVMVSSVRPGYLMAGKILGAGSAALTQVFSWIAILVIGTVALSGGFIPPEVMNALNIPAFDWLAYFLFFVLGFFLYAAMYAAMGSMVSSEQEAQSVQSLGILPLIVPMLFMVNVINDPLGRVAVWLGMIPFTAPITMPLRMRAESLPVWQVMASLSLLVAGLFAVTWVAGRIYRIGILSTGKKPTMAELLKWIKTA